jgi:hypothetical protein
VRRFLFITIMYVKFSSLYTLLTNTDKLRTNDRKETGTGPWRSPIFRVHCGKPQKNF